MGVGEGCISCWSQERLLPWPDLSLRGRRSPLGSPAAWHHATYGHGYPHGGFFFAPPQQPATPDYCCLCLCLKPALVLPRWDTTETKSNRRCVERGLPRKPGVLPRRAEPRMRVPCVSANSGGCRWEPCSFALCTLIYNLRCGVKPQLFANIARSGSLW